MRLLIFFIGFYYGTSLNTFRLLYGGTEIELNECYIKQTKYLTGILCKKKGMGLVMEKDYPIGKTDLIITDGDSNINVFHAQNFISIEADMEKNLLFVSSTYFYLFSQESIRDFKKIKYQYQRTHSIVKTNIYINYIVSLIKSNTYPYAQYIDVLFFDYDDGNVLIYKTSLLYQLRVEVYSYFAIDYCSSGLKINKLDKHICIFMSNYNTGTSFKKKIYIFMINNNDDKDNIIVTVVDSVELVDPSCGKKFIFFSNVILLQCTDYIASYHRGFDYLQYNQKRMYSEAIGKENVKVTDLDVVNLSSSYLVLLVDSNEQKIYYFEFFEKQDDINFIVSYDYSLIAVYNVKYEDLNFDHISIVDLRISAAYSDNNLILWYNPINYNGKEQISVSKFISVSLCPFNKYLDKENDICVECEKKLSIGLDKEECSNNCVTNYYCPGKCQEYKIYGENCQSCEEFLKTSFTLKNEELIYFYATSGFCEFFCIPGYTRTKDTCVKSRVYVNDDKIFTDDESKEEEEDSSCSSLATCYDCYSNKKCKWCTDLEKCSSTTSCKNVNEEAYEANFSFLPIYFKCLNTISSNMLYIKNKSTKISLPDNSSNELSLILMKFAYSSKRNIKINSHLKCENKEVVLAFELFDLLKSESYPIVPNKTFELEPVLQFYIYITMLNATENEISIEIEIESPKTYIWIIIGVSIALSFILISALVIIIVVYILRRNVSPTSKASKDNICIVQTSGPDSSGNSVLLKKQRLNLSQLKISNSLNEKYKDNPEEFKKFLKISLSTYPTITLNRANEKNFTMYLCSLCQHKIRRHDIITILSCNHFFHESCLEEQVLNKKRYLCQICNCPIITN